MSVAGLYEVAIRARVAREKTERAKAKGARR
jgi:hypothetical protein